MFIAKISIVVMKIRQFSPVNPVNAPNQNASVGMIVIFIF